MSYHNPSRSRNARPSFGRNTRPQRPQSRQSRGPKKEFIHPSRYIKKATSEVTSHQSVTIQNSFTDFEITQALQQRIAARGFSAPSPIQDQVIPYGLAGRDVIGIANTGTGKTMAFAIPTLQRLVTDRQSRALVMAPTRELAEQVLEEFKSLFTNSGIYYSLLIGGMPMHRQFRELARRPRLVIGTPGRIKDHLERESLNLSDFDILVLDEVDRMLDMGFVNDMQQIIGRMPSETRQSYFFSATINPKVTSIISTFSKDPVTVAVATGTTTDTVEQDVVYFTHAQDKLAKLQEHLSDRNKKILVFDDTRHQVDRLAKSLNDAGFVTASIHGGKNQSQRRRTLEKFKRAEVNILIATDVAARGLDVDGITHVINYSTPQSYDDYTHRIGRAGRAGKRGYALTFVES